jgi:hypothetical protein
MAKETVCISHGRSGGCLDLYELLLLSHRAAESAMANILALKLASCFIYSSCFKSK